MDITLYQKNLIHSALEIVHQAPIGDMRHLFVIMDIMELDEKQKTALEKDPETEVTIALERPHLNILHKYLHMPYIEYPTDKRVIDLFDRLDEAVKKGDTA